MHSTRDVSTNLHEVEVMTRLEQRPLSPYCFSDMVRFKFIPCVSWRAQSIIVMGLRAGCHTRIEEIAMYACVIVSLL